MMFRYQARITRRPDCAIRCLNPEATCILWLENARTCSRRLILPGVIGRRYFNPHSSNIEDIPNIVTISWEPFILHQRSHVLCRVICASNGSQIKTGWDTVVIVIAMSNQYGVKTGNVRGRKWHLDHDRHVKPSQKRVDHKSCAAAIDQESGHAQPSKSCSVRGFKRFLTKSLRFRSLRLILLFRRSRLGSSICHQSTIPSAAARLKWLSRMSRMATSVAGRPKGLSELMSCPPAPLMMMS